jgi:hypothetical protein
LQKLSPQNETVRVFYKEWWDNADNSLIPRIFHADFTFRGLLGPTLACHLRMNRNGNSPDIPV